MNKIVLFVFYNLIFNNSYADVLPQKYELKSSKINYLVTYLIKKADGSSTASKGKGECRNTCDFLIAAPVVSFESKDSNRDLNMLKVLKAVQFPLVVAKIKTNNDFSKGELIAEIELEFSGVKKIYSNIPLKITTTTDGFHAEGKFEVDLDNHKIEKPSLLGVDIKNNVPINIISDWKRL